ncbi:MAG: hypothetical protein JNK25_03970 [Phycisphaerae bacterium]|nr:hypothetical protein [Phycisphaerae bacterium]
MSKFFGIVAERDIVIEPLEALVMLSGQPFGPESLHDQPRGALLIDMEHATAGGSGVDLQAASRRLDDAERAAEAARALSAPGGSANGEGERFDLSPSTPVPTAPADTTTVDTGVLPSFDGPSPIVPAMGGADLRVEEVRASGWGGSTIVAGESARVEWTVRNVGTLAAASQGWTDDLYFSRDERLDLDGADTYLGSWWTGPYAPLQPQAQYSLSNVVTLPTRTAGTGYIIAVSDRWNRQPERNEANNARAIQVRIEPGRSDANPTPGGGGAYGPRTLVNSPLDSTMSATVRAGLEALADWASDLSVLGDLGRPLPRLGGMGGLSLGQLIGPANPAGGIGLGGVLHQRVVTPLSGPLSATPSTNEILQALAPHVSQLVGGYDAAAGEIKFAFRLESSTSIASLQPAPQLSFDARFDATPNTSGGEATLEGSVAAHGTASVSVELEFGLRVGSDGVGLPIAEVPREDQFFIRVRAPIEVRADVRASDIDATVDLGFFEASVTGGSASLSASASIEVANPDGDADGRLTLGEFSGASIASLANITTPPAPLEIVLPLSGQLGLFSLNAGGAAVLRVNDTNVFDSVGEVVEPLFVNERVSDFSGVTAADVVGIVGQVAEALTDLSRSSVFAGNLPFAAETLLSDVVDFGKSVRDRVLGALLEDADADAFTAGMVPSFSTAQGMARRLSEGLGIDPDQLSVSYNASVNELTLMLRSEAGLSKAVPLEFEAGLGPVAGLTVAEGSEMLVSASSAFGATLGFILTPLGADAGDLLGTTPLASLHGGRGVRGTMPLVVPRSDGSEEMREAAGLPQVRITARGGADGQPRTFLMDISGCVTVADVMARISSATGGRISASVDAQKYLLVLTDSTSGEGVFRVESVNNSGAVLDLGLLGSDEDGDGVIVGQPLHGDSWSHHAFIQDATVTAVADLSADGVGLHASIGLAGISATGSLDAAATVGAALHAPGEPGNRRVLVSQVLEAIGGDPGEVLTEPKIGGNAVVTLTGIAVDGGIITLGANPLIVLRAADLSRPTEVTVELTGGAENLTNVEAISGQVVGSLLRGATEYLRGIESLELLRRPLPIINVSVLDLISRVSPQQVIGFADDFLEGTERFENNPELTMDTLRSALDVAFGQVNGSVVSYDAADRVLNIQLRLDRTFSRQLPFDLAASAIDIPGGRLIQTQGTGQVSVDARAVFILNAGIDVSDILRPILFISDSSRLDLSARAMGRNLRFSTTLGPLGVFVGHPNAGINVAGIADLDNGVGGAATFAATLAPDNGPGGDHRYALDELEPSLLRTQIVGRAAATLPMYVGFAGSPTRLTPDLSLTVSNLADVAGTTVLTAPDLDDLIGQADLFTNVGGLVDGLEYVAGRIDGLLRSGALSTRLPLIGSALSGVTSVLGDLQSGIRALREAGVNGLAAEGVRNILFQLLQPLILDTARQGGSTPDGQVTIDDIRLFAQADDVRFAFVIGGTVALSGSVNFDIGLPALGLSVDGHPRVEASYRLNLNFGISRVHGFYFDTRAADELSLEVSASIPGMSATGRLGVLRVVASDNAASPSRVRAGFRVDLSAPAGQNGVLSFGAFAADPSRFLQSRLVGAASINLDLMAGFGSNDYPSIGTTMRLDWRLDGSLTGGLVGHAPSLSFTDVRLELGEFLTNLANPVLSRIRRVIAPIQPILSVLTAPLPVVSDIMGRNVDLLDLAQMFGNGSYSSSINFVRGLASVVSMIPGSLPSGTFLSLGSFTLSDGGSSRNTLDLRGVSNLLNVPVDVSRAANTRSALSSRGDAAGSFYRAYSGLAGGGFSFPIIESPAEAFKLLLGQDATLFRYDTPRLSAGFSFSQFIPIFGFIGARFTAGVEVTGGLSFGFDTFGMRRFAANNFNDPSLLAAGFFVSDVDSRGRDVPELAITGTISAAAELNVDLFWLEFRAGVEGGLKATVQADFCDDIDDGDNDRTKIRAGTLLNRGFSVFEISGELSLELRAYLFAEFCIDFFFGSACWTIFDYSWDIAKVTLLDFSFGCEPATVGPRLYDFNSSTGDLTLLTTDMDDEFAVSQQGSSITIRGNGSEETFTTNNLQRITISGGGGNDTFTLGGTGQALTAAVSFNGGDGDDRLSYRGVGRVTAQGGRGKDSLEGGEGADDLRGGDGGDTIDGRGGDDRIDGDAGNDYLRGGIGRDILDGGSDDDTLSGGDGDDDLFGGAGRDSLQGDSGKDWLVGGDGADTLSGGNDTDAMFGDGVPAGVPAGFNRLSITLDEGFVVPPSAVSGGVASTGAGDGKDSLRGGADDATDWLFGAGGADSLHGEGGADYIDAGDGDDAANGDAGKDVVRGGAGADNLTGGRDDDRLSGDSGNDQILGGSSGREQDTGTGRDLVFGGDGDDIIRTGDGDDTAHGEAGDDVIEGGAGADTITGGDDDDALFGGSQTGPVDAAANVIDAGSGDDHVEGDEGRDWLIGGAGADIVEGRGGDDVMWGDQVWAGTGLGDFMADGRGYAVIDSDFPLLSQGFGVSGAGDGNDSLSGGAGVDWLFGTGGTPDPTGQQFQEDLLDGGDGNDYLDAGDGGDTARGNAGVDWIIGGRGDDQVDGGSESDVLWGDLPHPGLTWASFNLNDNGIPQPPTGLPTEGQTVSSAMDGSDLLLGGSGADWLLAAGDRTVPNAGIRGDSLNGEAGHDYLDAGNGDDTAWGGRGSDFIRGGNGADFLYGGVTYAGAGLTTDVNSIRGEAGEDIIVGDVGVDHLWGGSEDDTLIGLAGGDDIWGGAGGDTIRGGAGHDHLYGGEVDNGAGDAADGADTIYAGDNEFGGGVASDVNWVHAGPGGDTIYGDVGRDHLYGFAGPGVTSGGVDTGDIIRGLGGDDVISGDAGDDRLYGGAGADEVNGGTGRDRLQGDDEGAGSSGSVDTLVGGADADQLVLDVQALPAGQRDVLKGDGDVAENDAIDADVLLIKGTSNADTITIGEVQGQGLLRVVYNDGTGDRTIETVWRQADGTPRVEQFEVDGGPGSDIIRFATGGDAINFTRLTQRSSIDVVGVFRGGEGTDVLIGGPARDLLIGGGGQDFIFGQGESDRVWGDDPLSGATGIAGDGDDYVYGGTGNDEILGQGGQDVLLAGERVAMPDGTGDSVDLLMIIGAERLRVGDVAGVPNLPVMPDPLPDGSGWASRTDIGLNRIHAGAGDDWLFAGYGADFLYGGESGAESNHLFNKSNVEFAEDVSIDPEWLQYARTLDTVWYFEPPLDDSTDTITVDYVTSGLFAGSHAISHRTEGGGFSIDLKFSLAPASSDDSRYNISDPSHPTSQTPTVWFDPADPSRDRALQAFISLSSSQYSAIIINARNGDDTILVNKNVRTTVWSYGGLGNDSINHQDNGGLRAEIPGSPLTLDNAVELLQLSPDLRQRLGIGTSPAEINAAALAWLADIANRVDIVIGGPNEAAGPDNDRLSGSSGVDWVFGGAGDDVLFGGLDASILPTPQLMEQSDLLFGGIGHDVLQIIPSAPGISTVYDIFDGGDGVDQAAYVGIYVPDDPATAEDADHVVIGYSNDSDGRGTYELRALVRDRAFMSGSQFAADNGVFVRRFARFRAILTEALVIDARGGVDQVFAQPGQVFDGVDWGISRLDLARGADLKLILRGGSDNDVLFGGAGEDELYGGVGADYLKGFGGDDVLIGNEATDTDSDVLIGDESHGGASVPSVSPPIPTTGNPAAYRRYGLILRSAVPTPNLVPSRVFAPPSGSASAIGLANSGSFLVKAGNGSAFESPTFTLAGPASVQWLKFTTLGDGGGTQAPSGEAIDQQSATRDRNFIRLLPDHYDLTVGAGAVSATLRQTGPSSFTVDPASPLRVRGAFGQTSFAVMEFDLSALLPDAALLGAATLNMQTNAATGGTLRVLALTTEADMAITSLDATIRALEVATVVAPTGAGSVQLDLTDAVRRALDAGRSRLALRIVAATSSVDVSITTPGRLVGTNPTHLALHLIQSGVLATLFNSFGEAIDTATGLPALDGPAIQRGLMDMRNLKAGTYYLKVIPGPNAQPNQPFRVEVTPPSDTAAHPGSYRDVLAGGLGADTLVGGRGADEIWGGVVNQMPSDGSADLITAETAEVRSLGDATLTAPPADELIINEPLPVNPTVIITDAGLATALRRVWALPETSSDAPAARLAQILRLDAAYSGVVSLSDLRWLTGLRTLTLAGNNLLSDTKLNNIWEPATAQEPITDRRWFDNPRRTPAPIEVLSLANNPLLPAAVAVVTTATLGDSPMLQTLDLDYAGPAGSIPAVSTFYDNETVIDPETHTRLTWLSLAGVAASGTVSVSPGQGLTFLDVSRNGPLNIAALTGLANLSRLILDGTSVTPSGSPSPVITALESRVPPVGVSFDGDLLPLRRAGLSVFSGGAPVSNGITRDNQAVIELRLNQPAFWAGALAPITINDPDNQPILPLTITGRGTRTLVIRTPLLAREGTYSVAISPAVTDEAGNPIALADRAGSFVVDRVAPTMQLQSPTAGALVGGSAPTSIDLLIRDNGGVGIDSATVAPSRFAVSGAVPTGVANLGGGVWRLTFASPLPQGLAAVEHVGTNGRVMDLAGNAAPLGVIGSFTVDSAGPGAALADGSAVRNVDQGFMDVLWTDVGATGIDAGSVVAANIQVTGVAVTTVQVVGGAHRYFYSGSLPQGEVVVRVGASPIRDRAGNAPGAGSTIGSFRFDSTAIVPRLLDFSGQPAGPVVNTRVDQGWVDVRWSDGSGEGLDPATIGPDDIEINNGAITIDRVDSRGGNVYRYYYGDDADMLPESMLVSVRAVAGAVSDHAGNSIAAAALGDLRLDHSAPSGVLVSPAPATVIRRPGDAGRFVDVRWSDGAGSGVDPQSIAASNLSFTQSGLPIVGVAVVSVTPISGGAHRYSFVGDLPTGEIEVRANASEGAGIRDLVGNELFGALVAAFIVDEAAPVAELVAPTAGEILTAAPSFVEVLLVDPSGAGVDFSTVSAADFALSQGTIGGIALLSGGRVRLNLSTLPGEGLVSVSIAETGTIADLLGQTTPPGVIGVFVVDLASPTGVLVTPGPSLQHDPGFFDVRWSDGAGSGIDPDSIGPGNVSITGVDVDSVTAIGDGVFRYSYADDGDALPNGFVQIRTAAAAENRARDRAGRAVAESVLAGLQVIVDRTAPVVTGVVINGGDAQRSNVERVTITFSESVNAPALIASGSISDVVRLASLGAYQPTPRLSPRHFAWDEATNTLTVDLTLDGIGGSAYTLLSDGRYTLRFLTASFRDAAGNALTEGDGVADGWFSIDRSTGSSSQDLFRLLGDLTGNASVDVADRTRLISLLAKGQPTRAETDINWDGFSNNTDRLRIADYFGRGI